MTDNARGDDVRWAKRLLVVLSLGLLVALPALWISSQYLQNEIGGVLSYNVQDGWCEAGVFPGVGVHCFGDYTSQALTAQHDFGLDPDALKGTLFESGPVYNSLYPPVSQYPHVVSDLVRIGWGSDGVAFYLYIFALAAALLAPALWVAWRWRRSPFALIPLIIIGIAAVPVIAAIDRGNSAGFVVPLLLAFVIFLRREPPWIAPGFAVGAALVRPQFILIALALIAIGRWRQAIAAGVAFLAITFASFAFTAAGFTASLSAWWTNVTTFQGGAGNIGLPTPANISGPRSLVSTGVWLTEWPGAIGTFGARMAEYVYHHPLVPTAILAAVTAVIFFVAQRRVPFSVAVIVPLAIAATASTVSPIYYLGFVPVIAALMLGSRVAGGSDRGLLDNPDTRTPWFWGWPLVIAAMLSLAPLPFVVDTAPGSPILRNSYILENIGKAWLALIVIGLAWVVCREIRVRWPRPAQAPSPPGR